MPPSDIEKLPYRPCAGLMIINADNHVFVGQRLDRDTDAWQMPQGGVDKGEDPADAALRELWEETGITSDKAKIIAQSADWIPYDLPHDLVPKLWKGKYRGQKQKWFLVRFIGQDSDINIVTEHPEFSQWKWVPVDDILPSIVPFKKHVYERVIEEFKPYL